MPCGALDIAPTPHPTEGPQKGHRAPEEILLAKQRDEGLLWGAAGDGEAKEPP